ncbi:hypothetical protein ACFLY1_00065 [Patescibacteria group bacterium]
MKPKGCIRGMMCELALWSTGNINDKIRINLCFDDQNATVTFPNSDNIDHELIESWIEDANNYDLHAEIILKKTELATRITTASIQSSNGDTKIKFLSKLLKFLKTKSKLFQLINIMLTDSKSATV